MVMLIINIIWVVLSLILMMMLMIVVDIVIVYVDDFNKDDIYHCC